jgi:hypothetical protein
MVDAVAAVCERFVTVAALVLGIQLVDFGLRPGRTRFAAPNAGQQDQMVAQLASAEAEAIVSGFADALVPIGSRTV